MKIMTEADSSMNFFDHIKELRQKLIYVIIFFIIAFIVSFYFSQSIFEFLAKPLTSILGDGNGLIYTALQEAFLTNVKVAFITAAFISFPFLLLFYLNLEIKKSFPSFLYGCTFGFAYFFSNRNADASYSNSSV